MYKNKKNATEERIRQMEEEVTELQLKIETILLNLINSFQPDKKGSAPRNVQQNNVVCTS